MGASVKIVPVYRCLILSRFQATRITHCWNHIEDSTVTLHPRVGDARASHRLQMIFPLKIMFHCKFHYIFHTLEKYGEKLFTCTL